MKAFTTLFTFIFLAALCSAQNSSSQDQLSIHSPYKTSQMMRGQLPTSRPSKLTFHTPQPQIASDQITLEIISPYYEEFHFKVFVHLEDHIVLAQKFWILPGQQKIPLHLYELDEGEYTLAIYRKDEVLAYQYFEVVR